MKSVLVTGSTGFIGRFLCKHLLAEGWYVRGTCLHSESPSNLVNGVIPEIIEPIGPQSDWMSAVSGIDTVMHLAARVHILTKSSINSKTKYNYTNTAGTLKLAQQAADAGVRRFVFMSTIGVNGNNSGDTCFKETDPPNPHNPYSISKFEAEVGLNELARKTGMEVVILRAPLVYGPEVPANFFNLIAIVNSGIPLPLASINNRRSMIYVGNLVDALKVSAVHPAAAGQTFLVSDEEDVSTPELVRRVANALDVSARLFPIPLYILQLAGKLAGKSATVNQLVGSLRVSSLKIRQELGWIPPFNMEEGLINTARWYKSQK